MKIPILNFLWALFVLCFGIGVGILWILENNIIDKFCGIIMLLVMGFMFRIVIEVIKGEEIQ